MADDEMEMAEGYSVQEFYSSHLGTLEDAGGGNMRFFRCIVRARMLIPIFSCVVPAAGLLAEAPKIRAMPMSIIKGKGEADLLQAGALRSANDGIPPNWLPLMLGLLRLRIKLLPGLMPCVAW